METEAETQISEPSSELWFDCTEAEHIKANNITDMNEWLHLQDCDPLNTTVIFEDCVYYCNTDARIGENRTDYVKGTTDNIIFPSSESLTLVNPSITDGTLTVTEGTINLLIPKLIPENAKSKITFTSSDPNIVSAEDAFITAIKPGKVTIEAVTENGLSDSVKVIVTGTSYDSESMNEAIKNNIEIQHDTRITSELCDFDFNGIPELIEYYVENPSMRSDYIYVYRLGNAGWEQFFMISGTGEFQLMIDNRTGCKNYYFNGFIYDPDSCGITGSEGIEGYYVIKLNDNIEKENIGSVILSRESDYNYFDTFPDSRYYIYRDEYNNQEYLTDQLTPYVDSYNEFYRQHTPLYPYTQKTDTLYFGTDDTGDSSLAQQYRDDQLKMFERYAGDMETATEKRAIKLKRLFIFESGQIIPEIVYSPVSDEDIIWYNEYGDSPVKDEDLNIDDFDKEYIYAESTDKKIKSYVCYLTCWEEPYYSQEFEETTEGLFYNGYKILENEGEILILDYTYGDKHLVLPETIHDKPVNSIISYEFITPGIVTISLHKYFADESMLYFSPRNSPPKSYPQSLCRFYVHPENKSFTAIDGVLFSRDKKELIYYPPGRTAETYYVPEGTEIIGYAAFYNNSYIKEIIFPVSILEIQSSFTESCSSLETIEFSSPDVNIDELAFYNGDIQIYNEYGGYDWGIEYNKNIKAIKVNKDASECLTKQDDIAQWVVNIYKITDVSVVFNDLSYIYEDGFYIKYSSDGTVLQKPSIEEKIKTTMSKLYDSVHYMYGLHGHYTHSAIFRLIDLNFDKFPELLVYPLSYYNGNSGETPNEMTGRNFMSIFDISKSTPEHIGNIFTSPSNVFSHYINTETGQKLLLFSDTYDYTYDGKDYLKLPWNKYNLVMDVDLSSGQIKLDTIYDEEAVISDYYEHNDHRPAGKILFLYFSDLNSNIIIEYVDYNTIEKYYTDYNAYFSKVKPSGTVRKKVFVESCRAERRNGRYTI